MNGAVRWLGLVLVGCGGAEVAVSPAPSAPAPPAASSRGPSGPPSTPDPRAPASTGAPPVPVGAVRRFVDLLPTAPAGVLRAPQAGRVADRLGPDEAQVRAADLDGDGRQELIVTVGSAYRRDRASDVVVLRLTPAGDALVPDDGLRRALAGHRTLTGVVDLDGDGRLDAVTAQPHAGVVLDVLGAARHVPLEASARAGEAAFEGTLSPFDVDGDGTLELVWPEPSCAEGLRVLAWDGAGGLGLAPGLVPAGAPPNRLDGALPLDGYLVGIGMTCESAVAPSRWAVGRRGLAVAEVPVQRPVAGGAGLSEQMLVAAAGLADPAGGSSTLVVASEHEVRALRIDGGGWVDLAAPGVMPAALTAGCRGFLSGLALVDLNGDALHDVVAVAGDDQTSGCGEAGVGLQHRAWVRDAAWGVREVSAEVGLDAPGNHGTVLRVDMEGDGDADLLLSGMGHLPAVLRNDLGVPGVSLRVRGRGEQPAVGARVVAVADGLPDQAFVVGAETAKNATLDPWVFLTAPPSGGLREVRVTWPDGTERVLRDVRAGQSLRVAP